MSSSEEEEEYNSEEEEVAKKSDGEITFEEQLHFEQLEKEKKEKFEHGKTKTDEDGTVFEWDADKKAWFPRVWLFLFL